MKPKFTVLLLAVAAVATLPLIEAHASGFASYFARVSGAGNVIRSSGVSDVTHSAVGVYEVTFNRAVSSCAFVASVSAPTAAYATVNFKSAKVLTVRTFASNGAKANNDFNMMVTCGP
jgi:hypothetical protein